MVSSEALDATKEHISVSSCSAYGIRVQLRASPELLHYLPSLIPGAEMEQVLTEPAVVFGFSRTQSAQGQPLFAVGENGKPFFCSSDAQTAARALESRAHLYVAACTEQAVFVHAGVVGWGGRAIVIPGPSLTGKSTLVAALVAAGATYYSDEYAIVDHNGHIHAFPRPLRLRPDILQALKLSPGLLAAHPRAGKDSLRPLKLGWVLDVRHRPEAIWGPRRLTSGEALLALFANAVAARSQSQLILKTLKLAISSAIGLHAERGDAATAAQEIIRLIDDPSQVDASTSSGPTRKEST